MIWALGTRVNVMELVDETWHDYCTRETIAIAKEAFNRKIPFLTSKLNIKLRKKLVRCYVWSFALYGLEIPRLRKLEQKFLKSFETWCWRRMEKIKWPEKATNE